MPGGYSDAPLTAAQSQSFTDAPLPTFRESNAKDENGNAIVNAASDFLGEATQGINPVNIYHALKSIVMDLPGTMHQIGLAQGSLFQKAEQSYKNGDYLTAANQMKNYLIPIIGPRLEQSEDAARKGQYAKSLGVVADIGLQTALPAMAGKVTGASRAVLSGNPNPLEASAVRFGEANSVPIDAGTATGSQFVKNLQANAGNTLLGSGPVEAAQRGQSAALERVGGNLTRQTNPTMQASGVGPNGPVTMPGPPMSPVTAGEGVTAAFTKKIQDLHKQATTAYDRLRTLEQQRATPTQVGTRTGSFADGIDESGRFLQGPEIADPANQHLGVPRAVPVTQNMVAVDLAATKASLRPMYDRLMRESKLVPLQGGKGRALTAIDRLMNGPDVAPLSDVDEALGDLKAMARGADMPELRTGGQAAAANAVKQLDARVRAAAAKAGPDVLKALEDGRAATTRKYAVADAMDLLSDGGPVQVYKQLTANKDLGLVKLRAVQKVAPEQLPNVARAYLEDAMDLATEKGGFDHADKLFADWQKLGGQTKQMLFPKAGQVQALDDFFLLAKKLKENPNPSGTARVINATNVLASIPGYALAKMLYAPKAVRALTTGMRISVNAAPAARAAAMTQVVRAAQEAGIALPAAATDQETPGAKR